MAFEKYVSNKGRVRKQLASIGKSCMLSFPAVLGEKYNLHEYSHADLSYEKETGKILVELLTKRHGGALLLRHRNKAADLYVRGFMQYFDIPTPTKLQHYTVEACDYYLTLTPKEANND